MSAATTLSPQHLPLLSTIISTQHKFETPVPCLAIHSSMLTQNNLFIAHTTSIIVLGCSIIYWFHKNRQKEIRKPAKHIISHQEARHMLQPDCLIFQEYPWAEYAAMNPKLQPAVEAAVLGAVLRHNGYKDSSSSSEMDEPFAAGYAWHLLHDGQFRQYFLNCWRHGCTQNLEISDIRQDASLTDVPDRPSASSSVKKYNKIETEKKNGNVSQEPDPASTNLTLLAAHSSSSSSHQPIKHAAHLEELTSGSGCLLNISQSTVRAFHGDVNISMYHYEHPFNTAEDHQKLLEWLSPLDYQPFHKEILKKRIKNTGAWFIKSPIVQEWIKCGGPQILWCPGIPGVGKTVITSVVIDYLQALDKASVPVFFIYFSYKLQSQQCLTAVIESLARQIHGTCYDIGCPSPFQCLYAKSKGKSKPSISELSQHIIDALKPFQTTYIILDALDEYLADYSSHNIQILLSTLSSLGPCIKLFVTSRVLGDMPQIFSNLSAQREEIIADQQDIVQYLQARLDAGELQVAMSSSITQEVITAVQNAAQGRFLMAELLLNSLKDCFTLGDLRSALADLPYQVDETYARIIAHINGYPQQKRQIAMQILMWITHSLCPLKITALQNALATRDSASNIEDYTIESAVITSVCAGLTIVENDCLVFVHTTAQEYFSQKKVYYFPNGDKEIATVCISYLCLPCVYKPICSQLDQKGSWVELGGKQPALYDYASTHWSTHAFNSGSLTLIDDFVSTLKSGGSASAACIFHLISVFNWGTDLLEIDYVPIYLAVYNHQTLLLSKLLDRISKLPLSHENRSLLSLADDCSSSDAMHLLLDWYTQKNILLIGLEVSDPEGRTLLYYAAKYGHTQLVELVLHGKRVDIDMPTKKGTTPLMVAAQAGHEHVMQLLIYHGADADVTDDSSSTALSLAAFNGHVVAVQLLLQQDAKTGVQDLNGDTPFIRAAAAGHTHVMELLLVHGGVDMNEQCSLGCTAFFHASENGHTSAVKFLLQHRDINAGIPNNNGWTPLMAAAGNGHDSIVQLLLTNEVDINAQNSDGTTPLCIASYNGHTSIVQLLLQQQGINIVPLTNWSWTPLMAAAYNGHVSVVKLLLTLRKTNINAQNDHGVTALYYASLNGHASVVQLLLQQQDVDIALPNTNNWTPLMAAAERGHDSVVQMLLDYRKININSQNIDEATSIYIASLNGHLSVVQLLLQQDYINIDLPNTNGWTPLMAAAEGGHDSVVQVLLAYEKININAQNSDGATPIYIASLNGHLSVVQLLLQQHHINIALPKTNGWTPLMAAAERGHDSVVQVLVACDLANINTKTSCGGTALFWASRSGHASVVHQFLQHPDISIDVKNNHGSTPLLIAAENGHESVVQMLLACQGVDINAQDADGDSPQIVAAMAAQTHILKLLLEQASPSVKVNAVDHNGRSALSWASSACKLSRHYEAKHKTEVQSYALVQLLLEYTNVEVDLADKDGKTPLQYAKEAGFTSVVQLLQAKNSI